MESLLSVNQAAFILKVHPLTIRRYIRDGQLKAIRAGGNVRVKESELQQFNRDIFPKQRAMGETTKQKTTIAKIFRPDDPLLSLKGQGATLHLDSISIP